MTLVS